MGLDRPCVAKCPCAWALTDHVPPAFHDLVRHTKADGDMCYGRPAAFAPANSWNQPNMGPMGHMVSPLRCYRV
jgi:hypothetical protein